MNRHLLMRIINSNSLFLSARYLFSPFVFLIISNLPTTLSQDYALEVQNKKKTKQIKLISQCCAKKGHHNPIAKQHLYPRSPVSERANIDNDFPSHSCLHSLSPRERGAGSLTPQQNPHQLVGCSFPAPALSLSLLSQARERVFRGKLPAQLILAVVFPTQVRQ